MGVTSLNEYLNLIEDDGKKYVNDFIAFMQKEYPQIKLKISFSIPMWLVGTKMNHGYIGISASKKHFSIHFSDEDRVIQLGNVLQNCKTGKRCINIKYGDEEAYQVTKKNVKEHLNALL